MDLRNLGRSGLRVSLLGLGCNNFGGRSELAATREIVATALDCGVTLFDTADMYGVEGRSEEFLGQALGARRLNVVLATKFGMPMDGQGKLRGASRGYIITAVEASLRRLRTDWIDLYQLHRPDALTPIEETLRALDDLIRQGKVRYVGCSNMPAWQMAEAHCMARQLNLEGFISCQDQYSLLERAPERELIPAMQHFGLGLIPYFPLASGMLTGKYRAGAALPDDGRLAQSKRHADRFLNDANLAAVERLAAIGKLNGRSMVEMAFGWLTAQKVVASVIAGASTPAQVLINAQAIMTRLRPEELSAITQVTDQG
jgi:aryl-alcohol dehydrogenase-like predicted oxidoreductase